MSILKVNLLVVVKRACLLVQQRMIAEGKIDATQYSVSQFTVGRCHLSHLTILLVSQISSIPDF